LRKQGIEGRLREIFRSAQDAGWPGCWMVMAEIFRSAQDAERSGCRMAMVEIFRFAQDAERSWCRKVMMQDGYGRDLSLRSRCRMAQDAYFLFSALPRYNQTILSEIQ
jgi:hypothetical protein